MTLEPLVSIVIPVFNDESSIAATLDSCLAQSEPRLEVICVDDASSDGSAAIIQEYAMRDQRVHLIRQPTNMSAFQARRIGTLAARADRVMFADGDDELAPDAVRSVVGKARKTDVDLIGFGIEVIGREGRTGGSYERKLQPVHKRLDGAEVLIGLFPPGDQAQGQLWRFLFRTSLVREAYALVPPNVVLTRVNDLPLLFLVAALARSYVSLPDRLYRYHFGRGGSGHRVDNLERAQFYNGAIRSINTIAPAVDALADRRADATALREAYESVRLSVVAHVTRQLLSHNEGDMFGEGLDLLRSIASERDIVQAAARFNPPILATLAAHTTGPRLGGDVQNVLLAVSALTVGGVASVVVTQARYLQQAGYRVTIAARRLGSDRTLVPESVDFVELGAAGLGTHLQQWAEICRTRRIDVVIDHYVLYTPLWPEYALMAGGEGVATIGWIHSFIGRPLFEGTNRLAQLDECGDLLARLVVLSPLDVAYFALRGTTQVNYAPNPPSELVRDAAAPIGGKAAPTGVLKLVWWGRLTEHTKRISELLNVATALRQRGVDFHLTIIGPDSAEMSADRLRADISKRDLGRAVTVVGALRGDDLRAAIDRAHVMLSTSIIEGYQVTIAEAQSRGLPVAMYELPWLTLVQGNEGIVSAPQGAADELGRQIAELAANPARYERLSAASVAAAARAHDVDYGSLYRSILSDSVPAEFSPTPSAEDANMLLRLLVFYAENAPRRTPSAGMRSATRAAIAKKARRVLARFPQLKPLVQRARRWLRR